MKGCRAADAAGDREHHLVVHGRSGAEAEAVARAPHDRAGLHVDGREGAVAGSDIEELAHALEAKRTRATPCVAPAGLAAAEVDGHEVLVTLGDDEELREPGRVDDRARARTARPRCDPRTERHLAGGDLEQNRFLLGLVPV